MELNEIKHYFGTKLTARLSQKGKFNLDSEYPDENINKVGIVASWFIYKDGIAGVLDVSDRYSFDFCEIDEIEIFMRPLSDLTKPCFEGGKVPIVELAKLAYPKSKDVTLGYVTKTEGLFGGIWVDIGNGYRFRYTDHEYSFDCVKTVNGRMEYNCHVPNQLQLFNWLYEHHFWLGDQNRFGKNIIDINTLEK